MNHLPLQLDFLHHQQQTDLAFPFINTDTLLEPSEMMLPILSQWPLQAASSHRATGDFNETAQIKVFQGREDSLNEVPPVQKRRHICPQSKLTFQCQTSEHQAYRGKQ